MHRVGQFLKMSLLAVSAHGAALFDWSLTLLQIVQRIMPGLYRALKHHGLNAHPCYRARNNVKHAPFSEQLKCLIVLYRCFQFQHLRSCNCTAALASSPFAGLAFVRQLGTCGSSLAAGCDPNPSGIVNHEVAVPNLAVGKPIVDGHLRLILLQYCPLQRTRLQLRKTVYKLPFSSWHHAVPATK